VAKLQRDVFGFVKSSVDKAVLHGHRIGRSLFGVVECYDGDHTVHFEQRKGAETICPMGAAAMCCPSLEKTSNSKARKAERLEPAIACVLGVHPDYVFGFAMGFDGHPKWPGIDYDDEFLTGYEHGQAMREHVPPGADKPLGETVGSVPAAAAT
jgi:hypothetical protein